MPRSLKRARAAKIVPVTCCRWQYSADGYDISGHVTRERDADLMRVWSHDLCLVEVKKSPRGLWQITTSDMVNLSQPCWRARFAEPISAAEHCAKRARLDIVWLSEGADYCECPS